MIGLMCARAAIKNILAHRAFERIGRRPAASQITSKRNWHWLPLPQTNVWVCNICWKRFARFIWRDCAHSRWFLDKEHDTDPKDMYEVQQQIHMRNMEHHHHSPTTPTRLLNIHSLSHPMQSNPPMHPSQKNHHLQQQQSQVSSDNFFFQKKKTCILSLNLRAADCCATPNSFRVANACTFHWIFVFVNF